MKNSSILASFGILVLRVGFGVFMALHGWGKIQAFDKLSADWFDPFNMGSKYSLMATIAAEFGCSALLILGFATRLSAVALAFTMGVAAFMYHANDPWITSDPTKPSREPALLYGIVYLTLIFTGPGKLSMDHLWFGRKKSAPK